MRLALRNISLILLACVGLPAASGSARADSPETVPEHWAFRKPTRPETPPVHNRAWVRTPLDTFILARLEKASLQPAAEAGRATLLRRVTFDLTGLPPTPQELSAFVHDPGPDAYTRVVDRLLSSPAYGERWAQHWLDVVRYADSNGYEADGDRPHAWRYRDYVIRAFNEDIPYDRFVTEQLAGDLLIATRDPRETQQALIATGFNRCGPVHLVAGNTDPEVNRQEVLTEMTNAVGSTFLGLTVGCARCHDHKFDPFPQREYYQLQAFFAATQPRDVDIATPADKTARQQMADALNAKIAPLTKQVAELDAPAKARLAKLKVAKLEPAYREALATEAKKRSPEQRKLVALAQPLIQISWEEVLEELTPQDRERRAALRARIHALQAQMPPPTAEAWAVAVTKPAQPTHVLKRGDPHRKGTQVETGFPHVLPIATKQNSGKGLDRLALARWLTHPDHPLTARVMVNRIWQHLFGRGLVATPNDFGVRGQVPTHPELLDWLSHEFVEHGWSVKHLQRLIVFSSAYAQESRVDCPQARRIDPDNRLLWRQNPRRLEGESLRDSALAVSGMLNRELQGPMVRVPLEPEVYELIFTEGEPDGLWPVTPDPREHNRRSIYLFAKRNVRLPLFEAFDKPDSLTSCPVRPVSTFAPQALILLNGPFLQEHSKAFASRLLRECGASADRQIERAYELALARPPRESELARARDFLQTQAALLQERLRSHLAIRLPADIPSAVDPAAAAALADFCLAMLNRNEFVYIP
jgi:hypothetical protein